LGYNYRLTDIQGALGAAQMQNASRIIAARIGRAERYHQALGKEEWFRIPECPAGYIHSYQSYVGLLNLSKRSTKQEISLLNQKRNRLLEKLGGKGIGVRQGTHAVHALGYYREKYRLKPEDCINSFIAEQLSITLPLYVQMTDDEQDFVVQELKACAASLAY
jgi:dTDP-4-amino-4,6-dideoxygalactose transaminase